jgi:hypothetical protein
MHDELAGVPPEEFVAARDELARRLKAEGDAAAAAEVKKLRKPTVAQWITEQVRRGHANEIDALRTASAGVATAQEQAITSGDRNTLTAATTKRREALNDVGQAVDEVLADHGRPAQYRDEVLSTIESDVTAEVASGTFGLRDDLALPERQKKQRKPKRDLAAERRAAEAEAAIEAAEERVRRAREALDRAESDLAALRERRGGRGKIG